MACWPGRKLVKGLLDFPPEESIISRMGKNYGERLRTPGGTMSLFFEEALRHRHLLRLAEDHFSSWGYLPVLTPVIDYFETYRSLLSHRQREHSYLFPDRGGKLLMLRSDVTLFLAKQMGLSRGPLPRRVYYADSIIRHQEEEDIASDELFQTGAELIGLSGLDGDLEVLMLLHDLLKTMRLRNWRMHIGSRALLDAILDGRVNPAQVRYLLEIRDGQELEKLFSNADLNTPRQFVELLMFLGGAEEFVERMPNLIARLEKSTRGSLDAVVRALNHLAALAAELIKLSSSENIRIDLSMTGDQSYYSGFTVMVYAKGANAAISSGGRYDNLLGSFGSGAAAAGFSMMMRRIEPLSEYAAETMMPVLGARGATFAARYRNAKRHRINGKRVVLSG